MQNQQNNFLDPRTLVAIFLSGLVFVLYSSYLNKKYPKNTTQTETAAQTERSANQKSNIDSKTAAKTKINTEASKKLEDTPVKETFLNYENDQIKFEVSSKGMGLKNIELKKYLDRDHENKQIGFSEKAASLQTSLLGRRRPLNFELSKADINTITGTAIVDGMRVIKTYNIDPKTYSLDTTIKVLNASDSFDGIETSISAKVEEPKSTGFLPGSNFDQSQVYVMYNATDDREYIPFDESISERFDKITLVGVGEQYFAQAIVDRSDVLPDLKVSSTIDTFEDGRKYAHAVAKIQHPVLNRADEYKFNFVAYVGPKYIETLGAVDKQLPKIIDYGFFEFLASPLLALLKWFDILFKNWGFAIIGLTIVVRFVLLPLHLVSYRSMKNMSKISPIIKEINEKYKDDPQVRGQKMMEVYKEYKVNPLSGCLPMLLQVPVFFALYQVIGQSIELYQAPFILWIKDLSVADPYYVLPILMGITMTLQMKLTPSTMDPKQAKIMMFMPIMFTFFMLPLPSGLTLYFFISGLFGIIQQYMMRDRSTQTNAKTVVAN